MQYLSDLMVRVLRSELEGTWLPVAPESVLRTVGTYENDRCVIGAPEPDADAGMDMDGGATPDAGI